MPVAPRQSRFISSISLTLSSSYRHRQETCHRIFGSNQTPWEPIFSSLRVLSTISILSTTSPAPNCLLWTFAGVSRHIFRLPLFRNILHSPSTRRERSIADWRTISGLSSMLICSRVRNLRRLGKRTADHRPHRACQPKRL